VQNRIDVGRKPLPVSLLRPVLSIQSANGDDTKVILVKVGPDQIREIYRRHPTQNDARVAPSRFVRVGNDQLLEAGYFVGGKAGSMFEYFWC